MFDGAVTDAMRNLTPAEGKIAFPDILRIARKTLTGVNGVTSDTCGHNRAGASLASISEQRREVTMVEWRLLFAAAITGGIIGAWLTAVLITATTSYLDQRMRKLVNYWRDRAIRAESPGTRRRP